MDARVKPAHDAEYVAAMIKLGSFTHGPWRAVPVLGVTQITDGVMICPTTSALLE